MPSTADSIAARTRISGQCWVAYIDVFGFAAHVERHGEAEVYRRLLEVMESIRDTVERHELHSVHLSDSIIIVAFEGGVQGTAHLNAIRDCVADVQDDLLSLNFIPRGSLACGTIEMSPKVIVGSALIRAVRLEQQLAAPCILLPLKELRQARAPSNFIHDVPTKHGGLIRGAPLLPRTLGLLKAAQAKQLDHCLIHGPAEAAQALKHLEELVHAYERHQANHRRNVRRSR